MKEISLIISKDTQNNVTIDNPSIIFSKYDRPLLTITLSGFTGDTSVKVSATLENGGTIQGALYNMVPDASLNSVYHIKVSDLIDNALNSGEVYTVHFNFDVYDNEVNIGSITSNSFGMYKTNLLGVTTNDIDHLFIEQVRVNDKLRELEDRIAILEGGE